MAANNSTRVDAQEAAQAELALVRAAAHGEVPVELVRKQRTAAAAFALACSVSGLEDKEIYLALGIDAGHFSRIKKGEAGFPPDKTAEFCAIVGNRIYPEWIAATVGCTLVLVQSEAERQLEVERGKRIAAEQRNQLLMEIVQGRQGGAR